MEDRKVFVGMIPKSFTESDVAELFSPFGTVEDCSVLKEGSGQSKGSFLIITVISCYLLFAFSAFAVTALTLLVGCQEEHPVCKN